MEKDVLRKEFLAKRDALDPLQRRRDSASLHQCLFQNPVWQAATTILCYVSFGSEVETHATIQEAQRLKKTVVVPLYTPGSKETPLARFGFTEDTSSLIKPDSVALALMPGIVFDRQGGRIGFGGGYFDRLLPQMPQAFKLGLAFSMQLSAEPLPQDSRDVRLNAIVTEKEFILIP